MTARMDGSQPTGAALRRQFLSLAVMEFWERFATSGVKSLLVLTLVDHVLAGDLSQVLGAGEMLRWTSSQHGTMSTEALASAVYGLANALIYLAIPIGGLFGDLLGRRRPCVQLGGMLMLAGLLLMVGRSSFLAGLALFAIGTGALKGNLSAQVGLLFEDDDARRQGYAVYLGFLNGGVICGPLLCGTVALVAGWAAAIAAAAIALAAGLACYAAFGPDDRTIQPSPMPGASSTDGPARSRVTAALLGVALLAVYLCYAAYDQLNNIFLLWARDRIDLRVGGMEMPPPWFISLDGLFTLLLIGFSQPAFRALKRRGYGIGATGQILLGGLACASGYLLLALGDATSGAGRMPLAWALAYLLLIDSAIVLVWPSGLNLIATFAPGRLVGFWAGLFYLHGFFGSLWVGFSGTFFGRLSSTQFWLLHAAVAGLGALIVVVAGLPLLRALRTRQAITTSA